MRLGCWFGFVRSVVVLSFFLSFFLSLKIEISDVVIYGILNVGKFMEMCAYFSVSEHDFFTNDEEILNESREKRLGIAG